MEKIKKINYFEEIDNLTQFLQDNNIYPSYLSQQINQWIIQKQEINFSLFNNISKSNRIFLKQNTNLKTITITKKTVSQKSKTTKYLFSTQDHLFFEAVLIEGKNNFFTLCLSSQIGCSLNCNFCATGTMRLKRNLTVSEIVEQYYWLNQEVKGKIKNIVFMGMGEPFLTIKMVFKTIEILNKYFSFKSSNISISTSGIIKGIEKLSLFPLKVNLCVSLHSAIQKTRDLLMPDLIRLPLKQLQSSLKDYQVKTALPILIEYILLRGINDDQKHLNALVKFCQTLKVKINLIAYNQVMNKPYSPSYKTTIQLFHNHLKKNSLLSIQRFKKGDDINAACGQLVYQQ